MCYLGISVLQKWNHIVYLAFDSKWQPLEQAVLKVGLLLSSLLAYFAAW